MKQRLMASAGGLLLYLATAAFAAHAAGGGKSTDLSPIGDKWAVVIGIGQFADGNVPTLKFAAKDAEDFASFLTDPKGGRFARDHVRVLVNENASKVNIMDTLGDSFLPHAANPDDLVVIYLSTHGSPAGADIRGVNYVIAHDTQTNKLFATGIEMRQLLRMIKERVHTRRILLVMDTCYSGAGAAEGHKGLSRVNINAQDVAQGVGSLVISSSSPNERAWESDKLSNSYFTRYLIDSLRDNGGQVSIEKAFNAMKQRVQTDVLRDKGEMQTPVMSGVFSGPSLVLSVPPSARHEAPTLVELPAAQAGQTGSRSVTGSLSTYAQHMRSASQLIGEHKHWEAIHELTEASKMNPSSVEVHLVSADVFDAQGRFNEALESAKRAVINDGGSARAREKLGRAYLRRGSQTDALRQAQQAVSLDPSDSSAHNLLGFIQEHEFKKVDEAEQEYRKALALNGLNVRALVNLGLLLQSQGKSPDQVESSFRKAIDADSEDWEARLALARFLYLEKGQREEAETQLRQAIKVDPANSILHSELGNVLMSDKARFGEAESELRKGIELAPTKGMPHFMLANFLAIRVVRVDEAEKEYRKAIDASPELAEARVGLGNLLVLYRNIYDEADTQFRKALTIDPKNAAAHVGLAMVFSGLYKNYGGAETELRKALQLDPKSSLAHDRLGLLLWEQMSRYDEARQEFDKAIAAGGAPGQVALAHYHLGKLLVDRYGANDAARKEFAEAIALDPKESRFHTTLGWLLATRYKKYQEAETEYRAALALNIGDAEAHHLLGLLLIERMSQRKAGEAELRKAHEQEPANAEFTRAFDRYVR